MLRFQHRANGWYLPGFVRDKMNEHFEGFSKNEVVTANCRLNEY
jgi:hypothetical protein